MRNDRSILVYGLLSLPSLVSLWCHVSPWQGVFYHLHSLPQLRLDRRGLVGNLYGNSSPVRLAAILGHTSHMCQLSGSLCSWQAFVVSCISDNRSRRGQCIGFYIPVSSSLVFCCSPHYLFACTKSEIRLVSCLHADSVPQEVAQVPSHCSSTPPRGVVMVDYTLVGHVHFGMECPGPPRLRWTD